MRHFCRIKLGQVERASDPFFYTQNTLYKQLYLSNTPLQVVPWNTDDVGQKPEFQSLIVATEEFKCEFSKKDEVSKGDYPHR